MAFLHLWVRSLDFLNSSSMKKVRAIPRQEFWDLLGIASQMFDRRHIGSIVRQTKPVEDSILSTKSVTLSKIPITVGKCPLQGRHSYVFKTLNCPDYGTPYIVPFTGPHTLSQLWDPIHCLTAKHAKRPKQKTTM